MKVGVIGLGNLGSAIACLAGSNGHAVLAWEYNASVVDDVNQHQGNQRYLPGIVFPDTVKATTEIADVFSNTDLIFIALPSRFIQSTLSGCSALDKPDMAIVNLAKGLDAKTGKTAIQLIAEIFPRSSIAMLAGPSLANEFSRGVVTAVVVASEDNQLLEIAATALNSNQFAVQFSDDVIGVELGGILKNIYALGMGIFDGRDDAGLNFIGAYLTQAFTEIQRLGISLGAKPESFLQLSGVGDLIATSLSHDSHNFTMGKYIGNGLTLQQIEEKMQILPEGYNTLQVALSLAGKNAMELPLASLLLKIIHAEISIEAFYQQFADILRD